MNNAKLAIIGFLGLSLAVCGCQAPKLSMDDMQPAPRPAEVERLGAFVGTWVGTAETSMGGSEEKHQSSGKSVMTWEAGERVLLERFEYSAGEEGKMTGVSLYWWEPRDKKYHFRSADSWGHAMTGTMTCDADGKTWHMRSKSVDPASNSASYGEGKLTFTDDGTQTWEWIEWDSWKMNKLMEGGGSAKRQ